MTIRTARGTITRMRHNPGLILLQVQEAADPEAAARALARSEPELGALGANVVNAAVPTPTGPYQFIDAPSVASKRLGEILDIVARHLEAEGVDDALLALAGDEEGPLLSLGQVPRAAVLRLYPPPPLVQRFQRERAELPTEWVDRAWAWAGRDLGQEDSVLARMGLVDFELAASQARAFLDQGHRALVHNCLVVSGELTERLRGVNGCFFGTEPSLVVAFGGPAASDDELLVHVEELIGLARELASEVGYALVSLDPHFGAFAQGPHYSDWAATGGSSPDHTEILCDELVLEAFPYQILGPRHLARLGGPPPGSKPLDGDRVELAIGEPSSWLLDPSPGEPDPYIITWLGSLQRRDPSIQERARQILAPCLMRNDEMFSLLRARKAENDGSGSP
jgi:hypothetical protein